MKKLVATVQGIYYIATGLWPLLSFGSFEAVTGPKMDDWLVITVGVLVIVIGLALLAAAMKREVGAPVLVLAIGSALGLAAVEFFYGIRGIIWPVYLFDAIGEVLLIAFWTLALFRDRKQPLTSGSKSLVG